MTALAPGHRTSAVTDARTTPTACSEWVRCDSCATLLYQRRLTRDLEVCYECGHHRRLTARQRVMQLSDAGSFADVEVDLPADDPLAFTDSKPFRSRLDAARRATGQREGTVVGTATIGGHPLVMAVMDFTFLGGSMGTATGEAIATAAETATDAGLPLLVVTASGGARMQEGVLSLLQMARTAQAMAQVREAGLLSVCLLADPTFGGVTASFATLGDVLIAEAGARIGFAGPRVISQTVAEELPPQFQSAESLLAHGLVDRVEHREHLRGVLSRLLGLHGSRSAGAPEGPAAMVVDAGDASTWHVEADTTRDPWAVVQSARRPGRPTASDHFSSAFEDFVELHGDRAGVDDPAIVGGVASIAGRTVVVVGHQKGHDTRELVARNFGMPGPAGYRKAVRLFDLAERWGVPVVTLVDTPGAYPGVAAEENGQSVAIAEAIARSARLRVPVVAVVTGEGGSGGALALATADRLLVCENAFFSVISPEGCAAILWRSAAAAPEAARALNLTAADLRRLGVADAVVAEPEGGADADPWAASEIVGAAVVATLDELCSLDRRAMLRDRTRRLRSVGSSTRQQEGAR